MDKEIKNQLDIAKGASKSRFAQRMLSRYGLGIKNTPEKNGLKNNSNLHSKIAFIDYDPKYRKSTYKSRSDELKDIAKAIDGGQLSERSAELLQQWMSSTQFTYDDIRDREERVNLISDMYYNNTKVSSAVELMVAETISGLSSQAFEVVSDDQAWAEKTNHLVNTVWNYNKARLKVIANEIIKYGDAFEGNSVTPNGILASHNLGQLEIQEVLEFNPRAVDEFLGEGGSSYSSLGQNNQAGFKSRADLIDQGLKDWIDGDSIDDLFKTYLFGYRSVYDSLYLPWQVTHFRYNPDGSEFKPYGRSLLLNCLGAFSDLQLQKGLATLREYLSLPTKVYSVKTGEAIRSPTRAFELVNTVREAYESSGLYEEQALNGLPAIMLKMWTADELVTVSTEGGSGTEGAIDGTDKLKFFDDAVAQGTGIPKQYSDVNADGFQMSGTALMQLYMPFQRKIETIRECITQTIVDKIHLHYSIKNEKVPKFSVILKVSSKSSNEDMRSSLELFDTVLQKAASLLGAKPEELPQEIKKDVLLKFTPIDDAEITNWINIYKEAPKPKTTAEAPAPGMDFGGDAGGFGGGMGGGIDMGGGMDDMGGGAPAEEPALESYRPLKRPNAKRLDELRRRYNKMDESVFFNSIVESLGSAATSKGYAVSGSKIYDSTISDSIKYLSSTAERGHKLDEALSGTILYD